MKTLSLPILLICCVGLMSTSTACLSKKINASNAVPSTIRYGKNGVPNFIKGDNLSAPLDADPVFQKLKAANQYADIALHYMDGQRALFKLTSARDEFVVSAVKSDALGQTHIRLEQVFHRIPVWGKDLRIHLDTNNQVYYVHGSFQPINAGLTTQATHTADTVGKFALQHKDKPEQWRVENTALYIWAPSNKLQRLCYRVILLQSPISRESVFVDAENGRILYTLSETNEDQISGFVTPE